LLLFVIVYYCLLQHRYLPSKDLYLKDPTYSITMTANKQKLEIFVVGKYKGKLLIPADKILLQLDTLETWQQMVTCLQGLVSVTVE
jgi:hypothetical protein